MNAKKNNQELLNEMSTMSDYEKLQLYCFLVELKNKRQDKTA